MSHSQFSLLSKRRFLPFFLTQTLGAFNDNFYKQALVLAVLFKLNTGMNAGVLVNLCALLFILPFFLFSALGGQLGECWPKERLMRLLKLAECGIMLLGAVGILFGNVVLMCTALFLMGTQSALFGPVKYAILPQHLPERELLGGNALVETGTFLAILGGSLFAGWVMTAQAYAEWVGFWILCFAAAGYWASRSIPEAPPVVPDLRINLKLWKETWAVVRLGFDQSPRVSRALIGNSWFWFVGATYLTQIPAYVQEVLQGDETLVTLILALFSVGIATGSLLCERLSGGHPERSFFLIPVGAAGLSLFGILLWWHSSGVMPTQGVAVRDWWLVLHEGSNVWAFLDILGLGIFGGFYIVPLYALIQTKSFEQHRTRVIAAANILNAVFMIASALLAMILLGFAGLGIPALFLGVALLNIVMNAGLLWRLPQEDAQVSSVGTLSEPA